MAESELPPESSGRVPSRMLSAIFLAGLPEDRRAVFAHDAGLEEVLRRLLADALSVAPQLFPEEFLPFIARSSSAQMRSSADLANLRLADLLLVYGYGREGANANDVIEHEYLPQIERSLHSYKLSDLNLADIRQVLRHRLWASHVPQPGIAPYSGRGQLLGWLRVTAIREAGRMAQHERARVEVSEQECIEAGQLAGSAEMQLLKAQYRQAFRQAFEAAMEALSSKDRNLLRYTYIDSLGLDEIAVLYKVHRATVARWLSQTREALRKQIRKSLQQQCTVAGVNPEEILQLIWSQIDVSIRHHLVARPD